jgi:hypothetical protein
MARRLTTAQWLGRLNRAGRTDAEIGAALGRSTSYIQKVRTGPPSRREAAALRPAAKALAQSQQRRTTGTARPLPTIGAPRRPQKVRGKQTLITAGGRERFYDSTPPRVEGGTRLPGKQLLQRIREAGQRGQLVRLTITWKQLEWGTGHSKGKIYYDVPVTVWREGEDAYEALEDIRNAGDYARDPERTLANLTLGYDNRIESVSGIVGWQLHTFDPSITMPSQEWYP